MEQYPLRDPKEFLETNQGLKVLFHLLNKINYVPEVCNVRTNSTIKNPKDIDNCISNFYFNKLDTGFTGAILEDFLIWKKTKK